MFDKKKYKSTPTKYSTKPLPFKKYTVEVLSRLEILNS